MWFSSKEKEKEYMKMYRLKNREILLKKKKEYYLCNKDIILEKTKNRYSKSEIKEKNNKFYYKNRLMILFQKKVYRILNIEKIKEYRNSENWKISSRIHCQNRRRKMISDWTINILSISELLISQWYKCALTWEKLEFKNWKYIYHIDHIIPISKWGIHSIKNVQITTPKANLKKYNNLTI